MHVHTRALAPCYKIAIAEEKSVSYSQQLLDILGTVAMRQMLNRTCPQLYHAPAQQLMDRIVEEISVSELVRRVGSTASFLCNLFLFLLPAQPIDVAVTSV